MGGLFGLPKWLAQLLFVVAALAIWLLAGAVALRCARRRLAARRPSPTRAEFLASLSADVSPDTAAFLWDQAILYLEPDLAPHPDDLLTDLPIDEDDWSMDWPRAFAEARGFHASNLPNWPQDWQPTLRNFGRWLDMSPI